MIIIQGIPGCGKTTLTRELGARERIPVCLEEIEENPYLESYYKEPDKYAFTMQVLLASNNLRNMLEAQKLPQCIVDTSLFTNKIFSTLQFKQGFMSSRDFKTYNALIDTMISSLGIPDLLVYLQCSPETAVQRILRRNRQCELNASLDYWKDLQVFNEAFYEDYSVGKKICINVDNVDIVDNESDLDYVLDLIVKELS